MSDNYNTHPLGRLVEVKGVFTDPKNGDAPLDPSSVNLAVRRPGGQVDDYEFGVGVVIVKEEVGTYVANINASTPGDWYYRWWSTGTGQTADEGWFKVLGAKTA